MAALQDSSTLPDRAKLELPMALVIRYAANTAALPSVPCGTAAAMTAMPAIPVSMARCLTRSATTFEYSVNVVHTNQIARYSA